MAKHETTDSDIRSALHSMRFRSMKTKPDTLIIDELGLAHAKSRIDVAVINGRIHGYEIKSERDTLNRLSLQIGTYRKTLQKLTIVSAPKHVSKIVSKAPDWCGIISAERGPKGSIRFHTERNATLNLEVDPVMTAHLLWRDEVIDLLTRAGHPRSDLRRPRKQLYELLAETMTITQITAAIRSFMAQRRNWRDPQARA